MYPMKMIPVFKDYLWGGERLTQEYGKVTDIHPVAESWEISCHEDGESLVRNGEFAGRRLVDVLKQFPQMLGTTLVSCESFPILIKLIDSAENTSLQVHPSDEYARRVENESGKNEMWYVLDAEPDTTLYIGLSTAISKEELKMRIENKTIMEVVHAVPVKPGDCYLIPAGLVHAIGKGALLAEIQQNSNITYRMYDYNRRDLAGNLRKLHIEKAMDVVDTGIKANNLADIAKTRQFDGYQYTPLSLWKWFVTALLDIQSHARLQRNEKSFSCLLVIDGELCLNWDSNSFPLKKGESLFIPAGIGESQLIGAGKVLLTHC